MAEIYLWIVGSKGNPEYRVSETRPPLWEQNGYWHMGRRDDDQCDGVFSPEQARALRAQLLPGELAAFRLVRIQDKKSLVGPWGLLDQARATERQLRKEIRELKKSVEILDDMDPEAGLHE